MGRRRASAVLDGAPHEKRVRLAEMGTEQSETGAIHPIPDQAHGEPVVGVHNLHGQLEEPRRHHSPLACPRPGSQLNAEMPRTPSARASGESRTRLAKPGASLRIGEASERHQDALRHPGPYPACLGPTAEVRRGRIEVAKVIAKSSASAVNRMRPTSGRKRSRRRVGSMHNAKTLPLVGQICLISLATEIDPTTSPFKHKRQIALLIQMCDQAEYTRGELHPQKGCQHPTPRPGRKRSM